MLQQQTINRSASFSGIGLHSGNPVTMTFLPAQPNTGVRFRRLDLEGKPEIEARVENVIENNRSTTLAKGNTRVHTVEHVLATFAGYGIDNAIVELDANEPPIGDGSAREYCKLIQSAGIVAQDERRDAYVVSSPIELEMGETVMTLFPDEVFKITCTSSDRQGRFTQFYSVELSPTNWEKELAHARTFCFFEEIEFLIKNGLIRGGSLENAVVIRDDAVLTTEPLRYPDEFVRHKMLDIVGDLSLLGRPVHGHLIAVKPNHAGNCELVRRLAAQSRRSQSFAPPPPSRPASAPDDTAELRGQEGAMETDGILRLLPHRYPFLMVDRVVKVEGNRITALKNVTINEPFFQGHFPGHPIMPGVLQLEAIAQVAGILMLRQAENAGQLAYFMSAEDVKWRKPVLPGDALIIEVEMTKMRGKIGKAKGICKVQGEVVSEAEVTFMLREA
ncbi:MAG TPA: bifunctional UDP-3-O-[3-hydroxymyristoyl] N-acetylglucosamine deacetylase/3-hydroxyacyl-ACP dehydratase [Candidatus Acidoferrum sp.]|jgi:UDP-3-O-[3-hydroxymyristoyl] N-acetylglucosamine deacetylase/3-hydroxyacyl-[acyl-carrier-protein] dehydratase|nr:bifunctional UDP-3-O-[3-hydroxymyristoyl] N-acetylglucosamine deacetylase/3-hydroxyacyl-ACP dehydratase [Candidatus Acidoferrum sp.]